MGHIRDYFLFDPNVHVAIGHIRDYFSLGARTGVAENKWVILMQYCPLIFASS